jgi:hypothetical protein
MSPIKEIAYILINTISETAKANNALCFSKAVSSWNYVYQLGEYNVELNIHNTKRNN